MMARKLEATELPQPSINSDGETSAEPPVRTRIIDLLRKPFDIRSLALTGLFVLAVFYTIYFTRAVLLPLVLALLLSYLLRPIIRTFARMKVPPPVSAAVVLVTLIGLVAEGVFMLATPAA